MDEVIIVKDDTNLNFETISDFKRCMKSGGEVQFTWNNKNYGIVHDPDGIVIYEARRAETECKYQTSDELLEHSVSGSCLRDIITKVKVTERTI